eukprot:362896-Chlamydomonas_euryale.AAC.8
MPPRDKVRPSRFWGMLLRAALLWGVAAASAAQVAAWAAAWAAAVGAGLAAAWLTRAATQQEAAMRPRAVAQK